MRELRNSLVPAYDTFRLPYAQMLTLAPMPPLDDCWTQDGLENQPRSASTGAVAR